MAAATQPVTCVFCEHPLDVVVGFFVYFCAASSGALRRPMRRHGETRSIGRCSPGASTSSYITKHWNGRRVSSPIEGACKIYSLISCGTLFLMIYTAGGPVGGGNLPSEHPHLRNTHFIEGIRIRRHCPCRRELRAKLASRRAPLTDGRNLIRYATDETTLPRRYTETGKSLSRCQSCVKTYLFANSAGNPVHEKRQLLFWSRCNATLRAPTPCTHRDIRMRCARKGEQSTAAAMPLTHKFARFFTVQGGRHIRNDSFSFVSSSLPPNVMPKNGLLPGGLATDSHATFPMRSHEAVSAIARKSRLCSDILKCITPADGTAGRADQSLQVDEFLRGADPAWGVCVDSDWKTYTREQLLADNYKTGITGEAKQDEGERKVLYNVQRFPADVLTSTPPSGRLRTEQMRGREVYLERVATEEAATGLDSATERMGKLDHRRLRSLSWRDYLSWLPPAQPQYNLSHVSMHRKSSRGKKRGMCKNQTGLLDSGGRITEKEAYKEWKGFPPPSSTPVDELPLESLVWNNETILYRQASTTCSWERNEHETRGRSKNYQESISTVSPNLSVTCSAEEKEIYGIPNDAPDDCWIPLSPFMSEGRLVQEFGLVPNITLTAGGYDYIETYHDPARNYTWSYKRWNPLKQEGEPPRNHMSEARSIYELETEKSRRYWHDETHPPPLQPDDGIFRQVTIADEMIKGMKRTPLGMDQWHYTPTHPLGQAAELQSFWLTALKRTLPEAIARVAAEKVADSTAVSTGLRLPKGSPNSSMAPTGVRTKLPHTVGQPSEVCCDAAEGVPALGSEVTYEMVASQTLAHLRSSACYHRRQLGVKATRRGLLESPAVPIEPDMQDRVTAPGKLSISEKEPQLAHAADVSCKTWKVCAGEDTAAHGVPREHGIRPRSGIAESKGPDGMTTYIRKSVSKSDVTPHLGQDLPHCRSAYQPLAYSDEENEEMPGTGFSTDMKYRRLGKSELFVSEVGLGTMTVGAAPLDESHTKQLLSYAVDVWGVNFIDTAELYPLPANPLTYGKAEKIIGEWLRSTGRRSGRRREELIIATKVAGPSSKLAWLRGACGSSVCHHHKVLAMEETQEAAEVPRDAGSAYAGTSLSRAQIVQAAEGSLRRLQTDYIDLFQFHWPDRYVPTQNSGDATEVLYDPKEARVQQAVRDSVFVEEQLDAVRELLHQGKYNLLCRNDVEKGYVELSRPHNAGTGLLAYGALAGGVLTGKYLEWLEKPTTGRVLRFPSYMKRYRGSLAARAVTAYYYLALRLGHPNLTVMALRWVLTRPFICSTLLGFTDYYQLRENLYCTHPVCGIISDWAEREINFLHWKWRDTLRTVQ